VKVKISYTVDVESIPTEIENVVDKIDVDFSSICDSFVELKNCIKKDRSLDRALEKISELRSKIFDLDVSLKDIDAISAGYLSLISQRDHSQEQITGDYDGESTEG
jgi:hypothetical protein